MKHDWKYHHRLMNYVRTCRECGKVQMHLCKSYAVGAGSTYSWQPLAGRCSKDARAKFKKQNH